MKQSQSYSSILKNRGFVNLWVNQILVQFAYNCTNFALLVWVFAITESTTAVAFLMIAIYLPATLLGMFAGVFVDLIDRKKIIIFIDLLLAYLFIILLFAKNSYLAILLIAFLINTLAQFFLPAESSALPIIVKKKQLLLANSLFSSTLFTMFLIGFGFSGPLISLYGINFVFFISTASLFIAFILANKFPSIVNKKGLYSTRLLKSLKSKNISGVFEIASMEVKATLKVIQGRLSLLTALFLLIILQIVVGVLAVILPSFLEKTLQIRATNASYIVIIPLGLGMIGGALLIGRLGHKLSRRLIVSRGVITAGLILLLVGLAPLISPAIKHFPKPRPLPFVYQPSLSMIMAVGSFILGMAVVSVVVPSQTVLQFSTKEEERGKVFGVLISLMSGISLLPILFAGIVADFFGTVPIFIAMGGAITILGFLIIKPDFFFAEKHLPFKVREFLGLGHWEKNS